MKKKPNPVFNYTAYKKDMLNIFEEALKPVKKEIAEIKAINQKLDKILKSLNSIKK